MTNPATLPPKAVRNRQPYTRAAHEYPEIDLDYLHARCIELEGCLLWNQKMKNGPVANIGGRAWKVRHVVYRMVHMRGPGKSQLPMPTACGNERCVHPDHLTLVNRNGHAAGKGTKTQMHRSRLAQSKRTHAKIDMPTAQAIRASNDILKVIALRYGISMTAAQRIKTGVAWRDYSNPFSQLMKSPP